MISGVLYALLAGLMWGLIFVGPLIVPEYPAMLQSMGRYLALGLIALPIAWLGRVRLRQLARRDWLTALMLTMMVSFQGTHIDAFFRRASSAAHTNDRGLITVDLFCCTGAIARQVPEAGSEVLS
ncbi:EamA family transporter [Escherichia coli]|nr:EamA family transporter [Escherichia coli]